MDYKIARVDNTLDYIRYKDAKLIDNLIGMVLPEFRNKIYIDIGPCDDPNLYLRRIFNGNQTIFIDNSDYAASCWEQWNHDSFTFVKETVTPHNVVDLINEVYESRGIKKNTDPHFLDLDIDGYDAEVLEAFLKKMTPTIICAEINEKIPPPIKFTVKYSPDYKWAGDHFYGMSISKFYEVVVKYGYSVIFLNGNTIYATYGERMQSHRGAGIHSSDSEVYNRYYRKLRLDGDLDSFDFNKDVDCLLNMNYKDSMEKIKYLFFKYAGKYEIS